jgi:hypothetical protein
MCTSSIPSASHKGPVNAWTVEMISSPVKRAVFGTGGGESFDGFRARVDRSNRSVIQNKKTG